MDSTTRLTYSRDVAKASSERDKCFKELGLTKHDMDDPWAVVDSVTVTSIENDDDDQCEAGIQTPSEPRPRNTDDSGESTTSDR